MQAVFLLKGLDCPNCASIIEREVGLLSGVSKSTVNLMKQTITISYENLSYDELKNSVKAIVLSHEPDVVVADVDTKTEDKKDYKLIRLIVGAVIFAAAMLLCEIVKVKLFIYLPILIMAYIILGCDVISKAVKNIFKGRVFDENFLMTLSTIGAFCIGEYPEAAAVMLFYQIGEYFQEVSVKRSRKSIAALMDIRLESVGVLRNGEIIEVSPDEIEIGEIIVVKPGEKIAIDGIVCEGKSMLDTKALTGESVPKSVKLGDEAISGCINQSGVLNIKTTKLFSESTVSKILSLVENASERKAKTENFITTFARYYTPVVVMLAVLVAFLCPAVFGGTLISWVKRAMIFLVISCPCALVISIPLTFFGGIGAASANGILIKGSNFLEALNNVGIVVFDKTGTLTKGVFKVTDIITANGFERDEVLSYCAKAESMSNHPIAKSIISEFNSDTDDEISNYQEIAGQGISALVSDKRILAGNAKLMKNNGIEFSECDNAATVVYVAIDSVYAGCIIISDEIKAESKNAIASLKKLGVEKTVMLTGDDKRIAEDVSEKIGVDSFYANLLPADKVSRLEELDNLKGNKKLIFVGDGINDAPVLARADIGVAMGGIGSDAAIEAADVVLMTDEVTKLAKAIEIARKTRQIVTQNIVFALGVKALLLIMGAFGIATMFEAVFADVGVALIAVFNAMRIMKVK